MNYDYDMIPRYTPSTVYMFVSGVPMCVPVIGATFHPTAPEGSCIRKGTPCIELKTKYHSRFYGCQKGWINSELRMVVQGFNARFEEMAKWEVCNNPDIPLTDGKQEAKLKW